MTFLAFRPFRRRKHRNDVIVTSYIKILQILKLKSKDITSKTLHAKFYASRIKNKRIRRGGKIRPPQVWSVFKSPGKIGLTMFMFERPVGTNARPQGRHTLLARPPGIFCCAKAPGLGTHFGAKAPGCPGGMVTGQIDTCITSAK